MVIPYVVAGSLALLAARWVFLWKARREYDRRLEHRIKNRQDLHRL